VVDVLRWGEQCEIRVVPPLCPVRSLPYDFRASGELIERAERSTRAWLEDGGLERPELPHELTPHEHAVV
jgi:NTE family protein